MSSLTAVVKALYAPPVQMPPQGELVGGGRILAGPGATVPLVVLHYDDSGVGIRMRWNRLSHDSCRFRWPEVAVIERAKRSLVVRGIRGRSFRFVTTHPRHLDPVVDAAQAHDVTVVQVRGTFGWNFHPD